MKSKIEANKKETKFDFHQEILVRLLKDSRISFYLNNHPKAIIPFPLVYRVFGYLWHFRKLISLQVLEELEMRGHIEIIDFHGIRVKKNVKRD